MGFSKEPKKKKKKGSKKKRVDEELNIRYHDVNPQWNYTISPRESHDKK
jgi:hypothetical protein